MKLLNAEAQRRRGAEGDVALPKSRVAPTAVLLPNLCPSVFICGFHKKDAIFASLRLCASALKIGVGTMVGVAGA